MKNRSIPQIKPWILELILLLIILAVAALFRFWKIDTVPAGLHYDEAIDLRQGLRILSGDLFLYTEEGWGREGLYYYLVATSLAFISDNVVAIRAIVALCSLGVAISSYLLARRFVDTLTAWLTLAWFAVIYWSVFASRFAVRGITLPLLLGLSALSFWISWDSDEQKQWPMIITWSIPGLFLGLSMYTYQPARFFPGLFVLFAAYLWLVHRDDFMKRWRGLLIAALVSILVSLPLVYLLISNPELESGREWTIAPLLEFLKGHPSLLIHNLVDTAKMFTSSGDPLLADNIPGRPIFMPRWTSIFFYGGLAVALVRWKKPPMTFIILWLLFSMLPTIVTTSAPNYNRLIGALFPITFLAALPVTVATRAIRQKWGRWPAYVPLALAVIALGATALYTWQDYFTEWPQTREDKFNIQFNVVIEEMADQLESQSDTTSVLINSRNIEDSHPYILSATIDQLETQVRWIDTAQAVVRPEGIEKAAIYLAEDRWISEHLSGFLSLTLEPIDTFEHFSAYEIDYSYWPDGLDQQFRLLSGDQHPNSGDDLSEISTPVNFGSALRLTGIYDQNFELVAGTAYRFFSGWDVEQDGDPAPLAFFVHLLDENNQLIAQQDGLGFPPHSWKKGDSFVHEHSLQIPPSLSAGTYYLQLGLYDRDTGIRWQVTGDGDSAGDRLLLREVQVN